MIDQASELRNLVLRSARERIARRGPAPRMVVLAGGKGGVGTTTLAVNLAVALSDQGQRVVLVDADLFRADVTSLCGIDEARDVGDLLSARCDIHEVIERGPGGIQVVPGLWAPGRPPECSDRSIRRLLNQFHSLGRHAEIVLVDVGSGSHELVRSFWHAADDVLVITTPDTVCVMDAYATIKAQLAGAQTSPRMWLVVNQVETCEAATDVFERINNSCQRFLGLGLGFLGFVPYSSELKPVEHAPPLLVSAPDSPAARAYLRLATELLSPAAGRRAAA